MSTTAKNPRSCRWGRRLSRLRQGVDPRRERPPRGRAAGRGVGHGRGPRARPLRANPEEWRDRLARGPFVYDRASPRAANREGADLPSARSRPPRGTGGRMTPNDVHRLDELVDAARDVRELAYAPYSNFSVGAAILAGD